MRLEQAVLKEKVEQKATELLIDLGLNPLTKGFELIRLIVCDLCFEDRLAKGEHLYESYSERLGWSIATVERLVSYGNSRVYLKKTQMYYRVFGWYGDEGANPKRNYEFLKCLRDYLRRSVLKEWDLWIQRDILINDRMMMMGVDPNSRGFYLLKQAVHVVMDAYGDLMPMKFFFTKGCLATNLTACSRALFPVGEKPKQFIYQLGRELLVQYPQLVALAPNPLSSKPLKLNA